VGRILPGKVASISPPRTRLTEHSHDDVIPKILARLDVELRAAGVELAQSLVAPDDAAASAMLRTGGYEHAADLLYLAAERESFPEQPISLPFELAPVRSNEARLAQIVDATYCGTLDCPRIDGLRRAADVLEGYRAVGDSGDQLWNVVREADNDVGCLLLADHSATRQREVVYVGLTPAVRGRGWGLELTRHAQWLARQAGCMRMVLAVDAANEPAIRVYATAGFRAWDRRSVWIKPLVVSPNR
jgi:ribosomal protein S18 acetylase RimI-like enzyme